MTTTDKLELGGVLAVELVIAFVIYWFAWRGGRS